VPSVRIISLVVVLVAGSATIGPGPGVKVAARALHAAAADDSTPAPTSLHVVVAAATPDGGGYWLVAADGGIFAYR
jgi:hypothetical protein